MFMNVVDRRQRLDHGDKVAGGAALDGPLAGKIAIVTGAGQGMGQAFAEKLCRAGAHVAVAELNAESGRHAADALVEAGMSASFYHVDVTDTGAVNAMVDDLVARFGRVDILINNAGIFVGGPSEQVEDDWERMLAVNLTSVFRCSQAVARVMIPQRSGCIVNIGSLVGMGGWAKRACYGTTKAGLLALTKILGIEWAAYGIRVNAVNPGQIETPFNETAYKAGLGDREVFANRSPMRRFGTPDEVADAVLFLATDESACVTAQHLTVDGGWMAWGGLSINDPLGS
jgi:3-oxoacyl-[acyl-carrier protein] reductase